MTELTPENTIIINEQPVYVRNIIAVDPVFAENWDNENKKVNEDVHAAKLKFLEQKIHLQEVINLLEKFTIEFFNKTIYGEVTTNVSDMRDYFKQKLPDHIPYDLEQKVLSFIDKRFIQDLNSIHNYNDPIKTSDAYFKTWSEYKKQFCRTIEAIHTEKHKKLYPQGTGIQKPCFYVFYYNVDTGAKHKFEFDTLEEAEKFREEFLQDFKKKYDASLSCQKKKYS